MYTVKQLAKLAGVSVRTLHYYDEIGLLKPSSVGENGYRYYADADLFRLQQILFFRELALGLEQIKAILAAPDFDQVAALQTHRHALEEKIGRMQRLITTVDRTIMHLVGEMRVRTMSKVFEGFNDEQQRKYEQEASRRYGAETVAASSARWNSYSPERQREIVVLLELDQFTGVTVFATNLAANYDPAFVRRILGHIAMPLPDAETRARLWRSHIPAQLRPG